MSIFEQVTSRERQGVQVFDQLALWIFHHLAGIFPPQAGNAAIAGIAGFDGLQQLKPDFFAFTVDQIINMRVFDSQLRQRRGVRPADDGWTPNVSLTISTSCSI